MDPFSFVSSSGSGLVIPNDSRLSSIGIGVVVFVRSRSSVLLILRFGVSAWVEGGRRCKPM